MVSWWYAGNDQIFHSYNLMMTDPLRSAQPAYLGTAFVIICSQRQHSWLKTVPGGRSLPIGAGIWTCLPQIYLLITLWWHNLWTSCGWARPSSAWAGIGLFLNWWTENTTGWIDSPFLLFTLKGEQKVGLCHSLKYCPVDIFGVTILQ